MNRLLLLLLLLPLFFKCQAQRKKLPFGIRFSTGFGGTFHNAATRHYFNNAITATYSSRLYYNNLFLGGGFSTPFSSLKDSLTLHGATHPASEQLKLAAYQAIFGYSFHLPGKGISVDPYIGGIKTYIENHNGNVSYASQKGLCVGISAYYYTAPIRSSSVQGFFFINNKVSFSRLNKLNTDLGNMQYQLELGFGVHWGSIQDYWQKRY